MSSFFTADVIYRLPLYIILGIVCEFLFTAIMNLISPNFLKSWNVFANKQTFEKPDWTVPDRDNRAQGYSFLWMIPIYMLLVFIEPASIIFSGLPLFIRGIIYVLALWIVEYMTGFLIKKICGRCPWDYSTAKFHLHGYIRFDFFFFWFGFMIFVEWISAKFIELTPYLIRVFFS